VAESVGEFEKKPKSLIYGDSEGKKALSKILLKQNYDTFNIFEVSSTWYYRKKVNGILYRRSLFKKNLKIAIKKAKFFNKLNKKELLEMFTMEDGDYKLCFEYETEEELRAFFEYELQRKRLLDREIKNINYQQEKEEEYFKRYNQYPEHRKNNYTFDNLEIDFVANKKKKDIVSDSSYKVYSSTFKKLKTFFKARNIEDITIKELEDFVDDLKANELHNTTINNVIQYVKLFYSFAIKRNYISKNPSIALEPLKTMKNLNKSNFTDEEIHKIINHIEENEDPLYYVIFNIAIYTGMRIGEILNIEYENIKEEGGIRYLDIKDSKTKSGIRKVPLHDKIRGLDYSLLFNISREEKNKYNKRILVILYKVILKGSGKNFHTFRGTFIQKLTNIAKSEVNLIKEIVGHSKGADSITYDTYAIEFFLENKLYLINQVRYYK